jgi:pilus assembly protein CpaC
MKHRNFDTERPAGWILAWLLMALTIGLSLAPEPARAQSITYDLATTSVLRIKLPQSQSVTIVTSDAIGQLVVADPKIADAQPVTDQSLYIVGMALGRTTVNLYSATDRRPVGLIEVEVSVDTADISRSINAVVPGANVQVGTSNGRVRLSGTVADVASMNKVLMIVSQYSTDPIINTITLNAVQQVNLEVRILEATRNAGRELGITVGGSVGAVRVSTGGEIPGSGSLSQFMTSILGGGVSIDIAIKALESKGLVRTLAEPNLTTLSLESASFLAGGQVPVRVADGSGNTTLQYKDFGVKLNFTPVVLSDDRIQIRLAPEVSDISGFTAGGDPIFSTRNLDSTIELRDGQSFSVAGLMQSSNRKVQNQLPWVGEIPVLGALFRSSSYQKNETELVVIVTPRLMRPSVPGQVAATPLDQTQTSNDPEFFLLGQLEVSKKTLRGYERGEGVVGPYGHIIDLDQ